MKEKYVPAAEINNRIARLQNYLRREDIEAALSQVGEIKAARVVASPEGVIE